MARSVGKGFDRIWVAMALALLLGCLVGAPGATAEEPEVDGTAPTVVSGELSPSSLPSGGGNVQISAVVVDDSGVQNVTAQVYGSDGSYQAIQLYQGGGDTFYGTLEAPANYSDSAMSYGVEIQTYDIYNNFNAASIGEVQVEGQPQFDESPYVTNAELNPSFLQSEGGTVTISADAGDNRGLAGLFALVTLPGGGSVEVPMNPTSSSHFEGTYEVPANSGPLAAEYLVEVVAQDDIGQEGRGLAGTITVAAPPPPPSSGRLEVSPGDRSFGTVKLGRSAQRQVFVRNLPRKGGGPVEATAVVYGSSAFSLAGGSSAVHFVLQPGQKRAFTIEFHPTASGQQYAAFEVIRDDGIQPGLTVELFGKGSR